MRWPVAILALCAATLGCHEPEREPPPIPPHPTDPANGSVRARTATVSMVASALVDIDASIVSDAAARIDAPANPDEAGIPLAELACVTCVTCE